MTHYQLGMNTSRHEVATDLGPVWLWGRDTGRPILLVISGAFAQENSFHRIQDFFPEADVLRTHLPGNHCPELSDTSIQAYATALDEAVVSRWPHRPLLALGVSTGGLVALALRKAALRQIVAIEPPILTEGVWVFERFREQAPAWARDFIWNVFGIGPSDTAPRDHTWVLEGLRTPTLTLIGDDPLLPRRELDRMPSLITAEARACLLAHPLITIEAMRGAGHNISRDAGPQLHGALVRAWNAAFPDHGATS